jgi:hypothetical protein
MYINHHSDTLYTVTKIKHSTGKLQFWGWKSPLLMPEHFAPHPYRHVTFLHAGKAKCSGSNKWAVPSPELQLSDGGLNILYIFSIWSYKITMI